MKHVPLLTVAVLMWSLGALSSNVRADNTIYIDEDSYAAVAYSPSTGEFHYGYNYGDRGEAEQAALDACHAKDARIVCWVNDGFCALAVGADKSAWGVGYEYGDTASNTGAIERALEECKKRTTGAHVVVCLSSDGQYIYKPQPRPTASDNVMTTDKPSGDAPASTEKQD